jgi:hypothetical protein
VASCLPAVDDLIRARHHLEKTKKIRLHYFLSSLPPFAHDTFLFATDLKPLLASSFAVSDAYMNFLAADPNSDQESLDVAMANRDNNEQALQRCQDFLREIGVKHFFPGGSQQLVDACYYEETMEALGILFTEEQKVELSKIRDEHGLKEKPRSSREKQSPPRMRKAPLKGKGGGHGAVCFECGRTGHTLPSCHSSRDKDGRPISKGSLRYKPGGDRERRGGRRSPSPYRSDRRGDREPYKGGDYRGDRDKRCR